MKWLMILLHEELLSGDNTCSLSKKLMPGVSFLWRGLWQSPWTGHCSFSNAAPFDEYLRLQQALAFAGFALHVVDRVLLLDVGIKAKDHEGLDFRVRQKQIPELNLSENRPVCLTLLRIKI